MDDKLQSLGLKIKTINTLTYIKEIQKKIVPDPFLVE